MYWDEKEGITYLNKSFHEIVINFVEIEIVYSKCHSSFFSKLKLYHKYIKVNCIEKALLAFLTQFSLYISIVVSKTRNQS